MLLLFSPLRYVPIWNSIVHFWIFFYSRIFFFSDFLSESLPTCMKTLLMPPRTNAFFFSSYFSQPRHVIWKQTGEELFMPIMGFCYKVHVAKSALLIKRLFNSFAPIHHGLSELFLYSHSEWINCSKWTAQTFIYANLCKFVQNGNTRYDCGEFRL